ncbi:hypothetical protein D9M72_632650 [compost metagenome]
MPGPGRMTRKSPKRVVMMPVVSQSHHEPTLFLTSKASAIWETPSMIAHTPMTSASDRAVMSGQTNATRPASTEMIPPTSCQTDRRVFRVTYCTMLVTPSTTA